MAILGKTDTKLLLQNLQPWMLVRLARDILTARRHTEVRAVDGPGDGGRDVHSLNRAGEKHLAQCKHHQDGDVTCSSRELAELPMALTKFGYSSGLFVSNARISPQAKREYLNDYPHLKLEFLDGEELANEVLSNAVLRALWFDGKHIASVAACVTAGLLVRRHDGDRPVMVLRHDDARQCLSEAVKEMRTKHTGIEVSAREGTDSKEPFEPYRSPRRATMEEGVTSFLRTTEVAFRGALGWDDAASAVASFVTVATAKLSKVLGPISVLAGAPYLTPLEGEQAGARTTLPGARLALVGIGGKAHPEAEWFLPHPDSDWSTESDARVTETPWVRFYSEATDTCVAYEIETPASDVHRASAQISRDGWNASLFALLPSWEDWPHADIPAPDEAGPWPFDGRVLCGWFHYNINGNAVGFPADRPEKSQEEIASLEKLRADFARSAPSMPPLPMFNRPSDQEEATRLGAIRDRVRSIAEVELVAPERARHMVALMGKDPLPERQSTIFNTADIVVTFDGLASPIAPTLRRFSATRVWKLERPLSEGEVQALPATVQGGPELRFELDGDYLVAEMGFSIEPSTSTPVAFEEIAARSQLLATELGKRPELAGMVAATRDYWSEMYDVNIGVTCAATGKPVVWVLRGEEAKRDGSDAGPTAPTDSTQGPA